MKYPIGKARDVLTLHIYYLIFHVNNMKNNMKNVDVYYKDSPAIILLLPEFEHWELFFCMQVVELFKIVQCIHIPILVIIAVCMLGIK